MLRANNLLLVPVIASVLSACGGGTASSATPGSAASTAPTVSLVASPATVANGASSTLTWSSTNATSCTASSGWSGAKATSGTQSTGALTASSSYSLTCSGSGSSGSASATVTVAGTPPPPPPGSQNFSTRCAQPGVLRCVGFDSASDIVGGIGANSGIFPGDATPALDATLKASGSSSLKFVIPANSGANSSGHYWINFSDNLLTQFGENSEFYIQWRQRFSPEFINTVYAGGGGWKQSIIGEGDNPGCTPSNSLTKDSGGFCAASCTQLEVVTQNTFQRRIPQMYHSCGVKDGNYEGLDVVTSGSIIHPQYATSSLTSCNYPGPYTTANCIPYKADQWMTFQVRIKIGTWYKNDGVYHRDTAVHLWIAEEGQSSRLAMEREPSKGTGYDLVNLTPAISKYGKVWLLPYHTGKSSAQTNPTAFTWYDELIISRNLIADPAP